MYLCNHPLQVEFKQVMKKKIEKVFHILVSYNHMSDVDIYFISWRISEGKNLSFGFSPSNHSAGP